MGMLRDRTFDFIARQVELIEFMNVSGKETSKTTSLNMIISDLNALDIADNKTVRKAHKYAPCGWSQKFKHNFLQLFLCYISNVT